MDPLTHIVAGRAVVAAVDRHEPAGRGVAWAAVLGALSPDIDAATAFSGWDRYVRLHGIGTHSILGAVAMACLTALVVRTVARLRDAVGDPETVALRADAPRFAVLFAAAAAGAMSHIVLDAVSGARIRFGWPIVSSVVTAPLVAMADPWLIAICVAGLLARWPTGLRLRSVSRVMIAAAVVLLTMKGVLLARALRVSNFSGVPLTAVEARWGSLTEWHVFVRTPTDVRAWSVDARGGPPAIVMTQPLESDARLVHASQSLDTVQNFLAVHEYAFPVQKPSAQGGTEVLWSDLRYCWIDETGPAGRALHDDGVPAASWDAGRIACGVWAGGLFGADGLPVRQLVKVGAVTWTRPVRR